MSSVKPPTDSDWMVTGWCDASHWLDWSDWSSRQPSGILWFSRTNSDWTKLCGLELFKTALAALWGRPVPVWPVSQLPLAPGERIKNNNNKPKKPCCLELCLFSCLSDLHLCFNFDTKNFKIFSGSKESQFGYTVQQHQAGGRQWWVSQLNWSELVCGGTSTHQSIS